METRTLYRLSATAAIIAGVMRFASSFLPWREGDAGLELLAAIIDLGLLFGFTGLYLATAHRLGNTGLIAFLVSATGIASIVGPDATAFGIDFYMLGTALVLLGTGFIGGLWVFTGAGSRTAGLLWLGTVLIAPLATVIPFPDAVRLLAGLMFGAAFTVAGFWLRQNSKP